MSESREIKVGIEQKKVWTSNWVRVREITTEHDFYFDRDDTVKNLRRVIAGFHYAPPHHCSIQIRKSDFQWKDLDLETKLNELGWHTGELYWVQLVVHLGIGLKNN
jgi:hypothetical protein